MPSCHYTIHNVHYSGVTKPSPHVLTFNEKPDAISRWSLAPCSCGLATSGWFQILCSWWTRHICGILPTGPAKMGFISGVQNFLVVSNNVIFGQNCLDPGTLNFWMNQLLKLNSWLYLQHLQEVHTTCDFHIVCTLEGNLFKFYLIPIWKVSTHSALLPSRKYCFGRICCDDQHNLPKTHLSLDDSISL